MVGKEKMGKKFLNVPLDIKQIMDGDLKTNIDLNDLFFIGVGKIIFHPLKTHQLPNA